MITVAMVFFAFTTLLGNCFYCDNLLIYIHKKQPEKAFMKGFRLVSVAFKAVQDYEAQLKKGINPVFKSADIGLSQKTDFWR